MLAGFIATIALAGGTLGFAKGVFYFMSKD